MFFFRVGEKSLISTTTLGAVKSFARKKAKSDPCSATVKDCMTACMDAKLAEKNTRDICKKLCGRCMDKNWENTHLSGGAFGSQTECFQHFTGNSFRPSDIIPSAKCPRFKSFRRLKLIPKKSSFVKRHFK